MGTDHFLPEDRSLFADRWWAVAVRGMIAIAFGVLAFKWPGSTLRILILLFGIYAIADGIFSLVAVAGGQRRREYRWPLLLEGIVTAWAGAVILRAPWITGTALVVFLSIWAMATGSLRIAASVRLRQEISGETLLALSGIVAVLFALILLMLRPVAGGASLPWAVGGYGIVLGILQVMLGSELFYFRTFLSH